MAQADATSPDEPLQTLSLADMAELRLRLSERRTFMGVSEDQLLILRLIHTLKVRTEAANRLGREQQRDLVLEALGIRSGPFRAEP